MRLWALGKLQAHDDDNPHQATPDEELDEAAAAFGLRVEHTTVPQDPVFYLLPEALPSWNLWGQLQGQWRTAGMEGERAGLDFTAVEAYLRGLGYGHSRRRSLRRMLGDVQAMETAAMNAWAEVKARKVRPRRG